MPTRSGLAIPSAGSASGGKMSTRSGLAWPTAATASGGK